MIYLIITYLPVIMLKINKERGRVNEQKLYKHRIQNPGREMKSMQIL